jgi:serine/threonine-protein kinase RsbW
MSIERPGDRPSRGRLGGRGSERRWRVRADPQEIGHLRADVTEFAAGVGVREPTLADLRLAVSEALTNVVVHAYEGVERGLVHVHAAALDGHVEICIEDDGVGMRPRADSPGLGLGLPLIASIASSSLVSMRAGGGTVVKMTFQREH